VDVWAASLGVGDDRIFYFVCTSLQSLADDRGLLARQDKGRQGGRIWNELGLGDPPVGAAEGARIRGDLKTYRR